MTVINTVVSVRVYTSSPSSLRDPLFHLCRVQSRAPGAMQILSLFSKTFSLSGFPGAAACPALLQAWVVMRVVCQELRGAECCFSFQWPPCLPWSGLIQSLCHWLWICDGGMASQALLEILLGLADLPQAGIISLPGNRQRHQGTVTDCEILGLGFLELLKKRK